MQYPISEILTDIKACTICAEHLPHGANPVKTAHPKSRIAIIGQAPGRIVHETGIPWNDKSGDRLREWMDVDKDTFYDTERIAIIPMGFCYPGTGKSGDLAPRKECAVTWHEKLFAELKELELILLIGSYAQKYYLPKGKHRNLTERVRHFDEYLPRYLVLPHPSPRNNIWLKRNEWFEDLLLPSLREMVVKLL